MDHEIVKENIVLFQKGRLSNWYGGFDGQKGSFVHVGIDKDARFNCVEQFMMATKAAYFGDRPTFDKIMVERNPKIQRELGRSVKNFDSSTWDKIKYRVVYEGNKAKYDQNPNLKEFLLSFPKDAIFGENSPWDSVWGIGPVKEENQFDISCWTGQNLLGKILTELKKHYENSND